ncbi:trypsin-like serine peptidase [Roseibium sp.]|uniref:trypsin-like serine peptidase n=1 Tax=Roseibium sp. TaxID=1936156 RepID=UPI003A97DA52
MALNLLVAPLAAETLVEADALRERVVEAPPEQPVIQGSLQFLHVKPPPQANGRAWRFWVRAPGIDMPLVIYDVTNGREISRISLNGAHRGTWSGDLPPHQVYISAPVRQQLEVKLLSWSEVTIDTQTPVGELNLTEVLPDALPLRLMQHLPGVGLLRLLKTRLADAAPGAPPEFIYCTAFLVSARYAVTADHCVDFGLNDRMADIRLAYVAKHNEEESIQHSVSLYTSSQELDLAILTLDPPASDDAVLELAALDAEPRTEAMILQHFSAKPLSISDDADCVVLDALYDGPSIWDAVSQQGNSEKDALFAHGCDTTSTSSGSPVLDRHTYQLIGMHQQGFRHSGATHNRALRVSRIRAFLVQNGVIQPAARVISHTDTGKEANP